jgi:hypothetical protein
MSPLAPTLAPPSFSGAAEGTPPAAPSWARCEEVRPMAALVPLVLARYALAPQRSLPQKGDDATPSQERGPHERG